MTSPLPPPKQSLEKKPVVVETRTPQTAEDLEEATATREMRIKGDSARDRVDVSMQTLDEKAQAQVIAQGLKLEVEIENQPENARVPFLFALEYEVIPRLLEAGVDEATLRSIYRGDALAFEQKIAKLPEIKRKLEETKWGKSTGICYYKLLSLLNHKDTPLSRSIFATDVWEKTVDKALTHYTPAKAMLDTPSSLWEKTKEIPSNVYNWVKTHKKETVQIIGAAAVVGGIALVLRGIFGGKSEDSKDDTDWKKKMILGGGTAAVAVGVLYVLSELIPGGKGVREWISDFLGIKKAADAVKEKVDEGVAWLDEKLHFSEAKAWLVKQCEEFGIELPDSIKSGRLAEIMKDMKITQDDPSSWQEYAQYAGELGGAWLLFKYMSLKKAIPTAAFYLLFIRKGRDSFGAKIVADTAKDFDLQKDKILEKLKSGAKTGAKGAFEFVKHAFNSIPPIDSVDDMLELIQQNKVMSLVAFNGLLLCSGVIFHAIKKIMVTGIKVGFETITDTEKSLLKAGLAGGALLVLYKGRRQFVEDVVNALYENPNSEEAKSTLGFFDKILEIDRATPETIGEKHIPAFAKKIIENPWEALTEGSIIEAHRQGKWALMVDLAGRFWLIAKGVNAPLLLGKLTMEAFSQIADSYSPESKGNVFAATVVGGIECYVLGSMAWEGGKATWTVIHTTTSPFGKFGLTLSSLCGPWTKEGRFIWRSTILNGIPPFKAALELVQLRGIRRTQTTLQNIISLAQKSSPNMSKIQQMARDILFKEGLFEDFGHINKKLDVTNFTYKNQEKLALLHKKVEDLAKSREVHEIIKLSRELHDDLDMFEKEARGLWRKGMEKVIEKSSQAYRHLRGFVFSSKEIGDLVKLRDAGGVQRLLAGKGISVTTAECVDLVTAANESDVELALQNLARSKGIKIIPPAQMGMLGKSFVWGGRVLGASGILISGYQATSAFARAVFTDVEGRSGVLTAKGAVHTAEAGAGAVAVASTGFTGGALGLAIAPYATMAHNAIDSAYEKTKTSAEWAAEVSPSQLVHEWLSTSAHGGADGGEYRTAGDMYRFAGPEKYGKEHQETRQKIVEALIMQEDGTKEVDLDRVNYIAHTRNFIPPMEYGECINLLRDSKIYSGAIKARKKARQEGEKEYMLGGVNILEDKYGGPAAVRDLVDLAKKDAVEKINFALKTRFNSFADAYLLDLFEQGHEAGSSLDDNQRSFMLELQTYLIFARGINIDVELLKRAARRNGEDLEVSEENLAARITRFETGDLAQEKEALTMHITDTAGCYALYELARFFGYTGYQNIDELKGFFKEDHKGYFGVYWDGDQWAVNEQGMELDNEVGAELNEATVAGIVAELCKDSGNILEHRGDSIFYSEGETMYAPQVKKMADILENGLKNYRKREFPQELPEKSKQLAA